MINNNMDEKKDLDEKVETKTPDETSGVYVESHVKIFDPETNEVYFAGRA